MIIQDIIKVWQKSGRAAALALLKANRPKDLPYNDKTLDVSLTRLIDRYKQLNKHKSRPQTKEEYEVFLASNFKYPTSLPRTNATKKTDKSDANLHPHFECGHEQAAASMASELKTATDELKAMDTLKDQDIELQNTKEEVSRTKKELKRTRGRENYLEKKVAKFENQTLPAKDQNLPELQDEIERLQAELKKSSEQMAEMDIENDYMRGLLNDQLNDGPVVQTYIEDSRKYSDKCKLCVFELLDNGVTPGKIPATINAVLEMVNLKANKLPSRSTIVEMNMERLALAQRQLGEVFSNQENTTILTDETSKFGHKYMGYEACDEDGTQWVLGLRDIETKGAGDTLKVFKEILSDLDEAAHLANNDVSRSILRHVQCTMSDRAASEIKFNELLETYRREALPVITENWENLSKDEQVSIGNLSNFFCGLHSLVNLATACQTSLIELEKGLFANETPPVFDKSFQKQTESGTTRTIRTACKAFAMGGDDKSGVFRPFFQSQKQSLKEKEMNSLPLLPYRGSRFNILFANAAGVYFLHKEMIFFLENYTPSNRLLQAVQHDLKTPEFLAGAKALGLIGKLVTTPLWMLLEDKSVHILDMNQHYTTLVTFLESASENIQEFLVGNLLPFGDATIVRKDAVYNALIEPSEELDPLVATMLAVLLPSMASTCKRLFKDHLPGGRYAELGEEETAMRARTKSVPKTSKFAESIFGALDYLLRTKPNISTISSEAYLMFAYNNTMGWLKDQDPSRLSTLLKDSKKDVVSIRKMFKQRQIDIENAQRQKVQEALEKKQKAAKAKAIEKKNAHRKL